MRAASSAASPDPVPPLATAPGPASPGQASTGPTTTGPAAPGPAGGPGRPPHPDTAGRLAPAHAPLLPGLAATLEPDERAAFDALRAAWHARATPIDAAERQAVDAIAACAFRLARLDALEAVVTRRLIEGGPTQGLPALATLVRARAGLARDQARAEADLMHLRDIRPEAPAYPGLTPARLRWLAARIEEGRLRPWRPPAPDPEEAAAEPAAAPAAPVHAAPEPARTVAPAPARPVAAATAAPVHAAPEPPPAGRDRAAPPPARGLFVDRAAYSCQMG